jgi:glyoxylase I family protein
MSEPHADDAVGLYHVGITVSDLDAARRFYLDGLGAEEIAAQRSDAPYLGVTGYPDVTIDAFFARLPGGAVLEVQRYHDVAEEPPREPGTSRAGSSHVCVEVRDLDATAARLEAAGGRRVTDPVTIDRGINIGARAIYIRDPDGFAVELFEPPADGRRGLPTTDAEVSR